MSLTADIARGELSYDPSTGELRWLRSVYAGRYGKAPARIAGQVAGSKDGQGYVQVRLFGQRYKAHRLIWLIVHGEWPDREIDHINRNRSDNRLCNLRLATRAENMRNASLSKNNTSGFKGVTFHKATGRWAGQIRINGKNRHLGLFDAPEAAHAAYAAVARRHRGEFAYVGAGA